MGSLLRKEDVRLADVVSDFLDKNFYPGITTSFERVNDKERQVKGIDVIFTDNNGNTYVCDEKNGGSRINTNLKTFSLELSFKNRAGNRHVGWLLNDSLENDSYLFIWTDKADSEHPKTSNEIHEVEIALIRKESIKKYLENRGITNQRLFNITETIINNPEYSEKVRKRDRCGNVIPANGGKLKYEIEGIDFCHSTQLFESPVNMILPRSVYREIADINKVISI